MGSHPIPFHFNCPTYKGICLWALRMRIRKDLIGLLRGKRKENAKKVLLDSLLQFFRVGPNPWICQFLWVVWAKWVPQTWEKTDCYAWMRIGIIWWLWFFKKPCMFANHIKKPWMDRIQRINYWFQSRFKYENEGSIQTQSSDGWLVQELEDLLNMEENFKKLDSLVVTYT